MHDQRRLPLTHDRIRVWQDTVAEGLLGSAVGVIALTGINPLVLLASRWLAIVVPQVDPVVTLLAIVLLLTTALVLGAIALKGRARRVTAQSTAFMRPDARVTTSANAGA